MITNSNASVIAKEVQANSQSETIAPHLQLQPTQHIPTVNELDELIKDRGEKVRLMKKDGDNSHKLLADLYGSPTHFVTELLQNAEDEGANNVSFTLTDTELIFEHDAKELFDFNDIRAISNFGDNHEKKEKPNAIGRFGIGFKSVYSITDNPRIVSADYDITIRDYNIPEHTNGHVPEFFKGTKIILPFKAEMKEKTQELLTKELQDLNLQYLLFLTNIASIKWETQNESGLYERVSNKKDKRFVTLKSLSKEIKYILLDKPVQIDKKNLLIKIAFQLSNDRKTIIGCEKSPLFVFFPTKIETNLKFLVHAPFYTTPARENIQEGDNLINIEADHRNDELKLELGKLLITSITTFKNLKLLNVELLNVLPIDKDNCKRSTIYKELFEAVKTELKSKKQLLPNTNGSLSSAEDLMLLRSSDLADLVNGKQAKKLFGRSFWLSKKITSNTTKILRDYLNSEIGIPEYDLNDLGNKIVNDFLEEQSDKWLIQFYSVIHKAAPALWRAGSRPSLNGILRNKPIIRVETNEGTKHVVPFQSNGKPNVFLPAKEHTKYATVKLNIAKNKEAKKFLEDLGLTPPDLFAEINEFIIPNLKRGQTYPDYFEDFKKIIEATQTANQEKRNSVIRDLKECPFILSFNNQSGETKHLKANEVYFLSDSLKEYFLDNFTAFYVAEEQYDLSIKHKAAFTALLKEMNVSEYPIKILTTDTYLTTDDKKQLRAKSDLPDRTWERVSDYHLHGLKGCFENITLEKSIVLWNILISAPDDYLFGKYEWINYSSYIRTKTFPAKFTLELKKTPWLYDINGNLVSPSDITFSQLSELYNTKNIKNTLLAILDFKPDEIKAIEERTGGKFIPSDEYERYKQWKVEQSKEQQKPKKDEIEDEGFTPEYKPEEAELNSRELDEGDITIEFNQKQGQAENNTDETTDTKDEEGADNGTDEEFDDAIIEKRNQKLLKDIGDWGQTYVSLDLKKEFGADTNVEIIDLNTVGNTGVGCDFVIKRNGEIIRLIEVKSTVEKFGQTLSISGTQWEIARNCFRVNDGDKYWIYCVFNAGREDAEILKVKNPIQKWKDGKLLAHPVNFIIK